MTPLAGKKDIEWSTTMRTTPVPDRVDFCLVHNDAFGDWVRLGLQLL
jgi:hypothetical protein